MKIKEVTNEGPINFARNIVGGTARTISQARQQYKQVGTGGPDTDRFANQRLGTLAKSAVKNFGANYRQAQAQGQADKINTALQKYTDALVKKVSSTVMASNQGKPPLVKGQDAQGNPKAVPMDYNKQLPAADVVLTLKNLGFWDYVPAKIMPKFQSGQPYPRKDLENDMRQTVDNWNKQTLGGTRKDVDVDPDVDGGGITVDPADPNANPPKPTSTTKTGKANFSKKNL
tara:strand:+ start:27318 stop:28007 length:690 start_codon:yes stop_codon:yes gene_type:complete